MGEPAFKQDERFTYAQYKTWPEEERWELIRGVAWSMSPAPRVRHQDLVLNLAAKLQNWFKGKPCKPFISPIDVFWPESPDQKMDEVDTVTQPDLLVLCDRSKVLERGIWGAPDWIIEILSPTTMGKDLTEKRDLHEQAGVREYWAVNYQTFEVFIYILGAEGKFALPEAGSLKMGVRPRIFPDLELKVTPEDLEF